MDTFIQVDGLRTRYLEEGTGPAVVLLHGISLGSSSEVWEEGLGPFARAGFRVLAYDQPGFGLTDNPKDFSEAYQNDFLLAFMDALGIERAALIGHSYSGQIAVRHALENPRRVVKVVVVATGSLLPPLPGEAPAPDGQGGDDSPPSLESTRKILEGQLFHKRLITPDIVDRRYRMSTGKNFEAHLERKKVRQPQRDLGPLWQRLKEVPVPLLMLYGSHDRGRAAERCAVLREREPALHVEVIENASHLLMWDAREAFRRKVLDFLS